MKKNALVLTGFYVSVQKCHLYITFLFTIQMARKTSEDKKFLSVKTFLPWNQ